MHDLFPTPLTRIFLPLWAFAQHIGYCNSNDVIEGLEMIANHPTWTGRVSVEGHSIMRCRLATTQGVFLQYGSVKHVACPGHTKVPPWLHMRTQPASHVIDMCTLTRV
jgi:hypothetical protein